MAQAEPIRRTLERHLQSILDGDVGTYHATTSAEATLYEWYVTPHRIEGLPFHDFMMIETGRPGSAATPLDPLPSSGGAADKPRQRFDLANYAEQVYGETAVCSYTLLVARSSPAGVAVRAHNETRVLVRMDDGWKVVHVHKSPAWKAPYEAPA
jgi:hypothetical protein